ncbi:MAG: molybdate ABC transporter permease subunit [Alphaproteobacteria bacterium]|jgi:molybdate transport system permease protein|nr:molybdate ABC transporter permease subunit [Rhodospirillaceae bacterium]MDP6022793.1 molybdate ABC transporter permease subunit [Alphaproteobacteria bacterium]MDP6253891.1 molybdate ABC transporter permease subunit [Alphaproteobacteria bacterium]MDP7056470.1 molybdate ABC transporter permease subunit [Alphaproteobacteria bacterium]MDP7230423.1 molybdate ABC transporter permease subunit [Alphaproteobacteria bacterium]|tara:strand:- start:6207 stop:6896 length:690 start_codon:yes stop_codon:yes gene_type:complete
MLSPLEIEALSLSLKVALWAVACSLPLGIAVAWLLARREFPGKALLDGIVHLPLVLPPVALGYVLLVLFGRTGPLGIWLHDWLGINLVFSWRGAALAAAVMAFPLLVRAVRLSMEAVDRRLETAAQTLGAKPWRVFLTITVPLTAPGILTGLLLSFIRCLGEFGATITFAANVPGETRTLPLALYTALQIPGGEAGATRLALISVALAIIALVASQYLAKQVSKRIGLS